MKVHKLTLKYNIHNYFKFKQYAEKILPNKIKYPLINDALQPIASLSFDSNFQANAGFFPLSQASICYNKKFKKFILSSLNFNIINSLFTYLIRIIFLIFANISILKINYPTCDIESTNYKIDNVFIEVNFLNKRKHYKLKSKNIINKFLKTLSTSTISPFTVILLYLLSLPIRINKNNVQYLYKINPFFLFILEKSFKYDLYITKLFLNFLKIKEFKNNGWFSVKGSILFKAISTLNINSIVYAHGHLSHTTLAFYYPIKSNEFITLTEEESLRIKGLSNYLGKYKNEISFLINSERLSNMGLRSPFSSNPKNIIIGLSTPDILQESKIFEIYKFLIYSLVDFNFKVFYRPHHHTTSIEEKLLSLNGELQSYKKCINSLDKRNTIILGSSTTLLLDAFSSGIKSYEISDFMQSPSGFIKSLPCYTVNEFLSLAKKVF